MGKQALIYCRVSTRKQDEEGASLETQERSCRQEATRQGYDVGPVFREVYTGAEVFDRPQLNALRQEVRTRKYAAVIVHAIDRLTRAQGLTAYLLSEFDRAGVQLVSVTDPLEATKEGKLIISIKEYVAEVEREKIKERSLRGKLGRLQAGKLHRAGTDLYGYRRDQEGTHREIYEPEAAIVRDIFEMVAVEGKGTRTVANALNARGVPSPTRGKRSYSGEGHQSAEPLWGKSTIARILKEPAYRGDTILWRWQTDARSKTMKQRPEEQHIHLPDGITPPIVSGELWNAAQRRLAGNLANRGAAARNQTRPYLLRGLIRCAVCGRSMAPEYHHGQSIYRCTSRGTPRGRCGSKSVQAVDYCDKTTLIATHRRDATGRILPLEESDARPTPTQPGVERWAWEHIATMLRDPSVVAGELERREAEGPEPGLEDEYQNAKGRLAKIEAQQKRLIERFGQSDDDTFPWEMVQEQVSRLEHEKATVSEILADIERRRDAAQREIDQLQELTSYVDRVAANLDAFDFDEKRLALEALGVTVYADGTDWSIDCNIPVEDSRGISATTYCSVARRDRGRRCSRERCRLSCPI